MILGAASTDGNAKDIVEAPIIIITADTADKWQTLITRGYLM
jgi:hypothetical protein